MDCRFILLHPKTILLSVVLLLGPAMPAQTSDTGTLPAAPSGVKAPQKASSSASPADPAASSSSSSSDSGTQAELKDESSRPKPTQDQASGVQSESKPSESTTKPTEPLTAPPPPDSDSLTTIRKRVDEVNVIFTVTDKHDRFVKELSKSDFKVLDDKQLQQQIVNFRSETDLPLRVGLLVDASNSIRDRFKFEQQAAIEFLNQIIRPRYDKAFVIGFDTTAEVTQDFTDSSERLSHGVRMLRPGGGTAMFDALYFACRDKLAKSDQSGNSMRRVIILLSDGDDNQSRVSREEAIEMAQRAEVIVYTISTNISGVKGRGDKVLERIADATGGRAFTPFRVEDVANAFSEIQDELRSQYALAYRPQDFKRDGRYHAIQIVALKHKDLRVRSRRGYYAPNQ
jgi:Ca-activated chloride channel family protein